MKLEIGGFAERSHMRHERHLTVKHYTKIPGGGGGQDIISVHSQCCLLLGGCEISASNFDKLGLVAVKFRFVEE